MTFIDFAKLQNTEKHQENASFRITTTLDNYRTCKIRKYKHISDHYHYPLTVTRIIETNRNFSGSCLVIKWGSKFFIYKVYEEYVNKPLEILWCKYKELQICN